MNPKLTSRWPLAALLVLATLVVAVVAYIVIFAMGSNGASNYSGVENDVAQKAIKFEERNSSISPLPSFMRKLSVTSVRAITEAEASQYCAKDDKTMEVSADNHYVVVMKDQRLLGQVSTVTQYGCVLMTFDPGYFE